MLCDAVPDSRSAVDVDHQIGRTPITCMWYYCMHIFHPLWHCAAASLLMLALICFAYECALQMITNLNL